MKSNEMFRIKMPSAKKEKKSFQTFTLLSYVSDISATFKDAGCHLLVKSLYFGSNILIYRPCINSLLLFLIQMTFRRQINLNVELTTLINGKLLSLETKEENLYEILCMFFRLLHETITTYIF
jgi:hypothetical protein